MRYRVRYLHRDSGEVARFALMERDAAISIARELVSERERDVQIEDETGQLWSIEGLAGC